MGILWAVNLSVSETPHEAWNAIMPFIVVLELPVFLMEVSDALMQCENSLFSQKKNLKTDIQAWASCPGTVQKMEICVYDKPEQWCW